MFQPRLRCSSLIAILVAQLLLGCATPEKESDPLQLQVDQQILESLRRIESAQATLYQAGAINDTTEKPPVPVAKDEQRLTISWQGDALALLIRLAHERGRPFSFVGTQLPLPVNVAVKDEPYSHLLQLIKTQIGYRAQLIEYPDRMVLQYNVPPRPQSGATPR